MCPAKNVVTAPPVVVATVIAGPPMEETSTTGAPAMAAAKDAPRGTCKPQHPRQRGRKHSLVMYAVNWLWLAEGSWWIARLAWSNMMLAVAEGVSMAEGARVSEQAGRTFYGCD